MITQKYLHKLFDYKDGNLYWKVRKSYKIHIGDRAGSLNQNGYYNIKINNKLYKIHRLIFLYHHDYLPKEIDHIDRNPLNNKIENLRFITHRENMMNQKSAKNTSSIYKGVSWKKENQKWQAYITINGKRKYLGYFTNEKDAAIYYNENAIKYFKKYAHLNEVI